MTILINVLLLLVIVTCAILLFRSWRIVHDTSKILYSGDKIAIVTRIDKGKKSTDVQKEWRIKFFVVCGSILFAVTFLIIGLAVRGTTSLPQFFLLFWLPVYALMMFKVPMFRLRREDMVIDERVVPYETINQIKAEDIGIGHMKYGLFEGADEYVDVTIYYKKKMKRNVSFSVHKEDYHDLMNEWKQVQGTLPLEEDIRWPEKENGNLT